MEDDNTTTPPTPEDDNPQEKPASRMDDLLDAKAESEKQAEEWRKIEQQGKAVPSANPPEIDEPPRQQGDTPTGEQTPPEGVPKIDPYRLAQIVGDVGKEEPSAQTEEDPQTPPEDIPDPEPPASNDPPPAQQKRRPPPRFYHPTDNPAEVDEPVDEDAPFVIPPDEPEQAEPKEDAPFFITPSDAGWSSGSSGEGTTPVEDPTERQEQTPTEPPGGRTTSPAADMPLPRRVPTEDPDATITTPSAFRDPDPEPTMPSGHKRPDLTQPSGHERPDLTQPSRRPPQVSRAPQSPPPEQRSRAPEPPPPAAEVVPPSYSSSRGSTSQGVPVSQPKRKKQRKPRITMGCVARTVGLTLLGGVVAFLLVGGAAAIYYSQVTAPTFRDINDITDLQERALQFETTRIRDSEGNILYQINDPEGGFRDYVELEEISPWVIYATVATEEREYFTNPGFSIPAIIRAVVQNVREGAAVSGASTITQQLTRALLLPEEERTQRTVERKIKEIFLAAELGRRFSKEEILELYLNQIYYGNLAYGIESASQLYFDKPASDLNAAEAALLTGIPQAPAVWDPVSDPDAAYFRMREQVFVLMLDAGRQGGIDTGRTNLQLPVFTDQEFIEATRYVEENFPESFDAPDFAARYPHWVVYITQQLENDEAIGPSIYTSGYDVYTTLDPRIQDVAQAQVDTTIAGLVDRNVTNASVVVIDADTGAILALVGSRDFNDESIDGQVNIALSPQQPGSSIKPFTYLTAFREGWGPGSVIWDVPIQYEIPGFGVYEPTNYGDSGFAGPVSARYALANSLNVPAVLTLDYVGVDSLLETLNDVGVQSLGTPENEFGYGLSLTLGAGEVQLLEWTNAYATLANGGTYRPPYAIERIELNGEVIQQYEVPEGEQVLDPDNLYLLQSILTDYQARVPSFGSNSPLSPPGYVAGAKTGTTNDFRDNWTMGFTTEIATGVWVGNTDNSPMFNVTGVTGAGPIWRGVMDAAQQWYPSGQFQRPPGVQQYTICRDSGAQPSAFCEEIGRTAEEIFDADTPPAPAEEAGLYRELEIDTFTGLIANEFCDEYTRTELFLVIPNPSQLIDVPAFGYDWLLNNDRGRAWANGRNIDFNQFSAEPPPSEACDANTPRPEVVITNPQASSVQEGVILVRGSAAAPGFDYYFVDFGLSDDPQGWTPVQGRTDVEVRDGVLGQFDLSPFVGGQQTTATIRVVVVDEAGNRAEQRVTFQIAQATPTPTPTITPTPDEDEPTATPEAGTATPTLTPTPDEEEGGDGG